MRVPADRQRLGTSYAATSDGRRFLIPVTAGDPPPAAITVVLNWKPSLGR